MKHLRLKLFPKYAAMIIALVGVLLVASGGVGLYFSWRELQEHIVELQFEKAQAAATRIEQYVLDIEHQVSWTTLPGMDAGGDAAEQRRIDYLKLLRQAQAITEVVYLDAQGKEQLLVSRLAMEAVGRGTDRADTEMFKNASGGKVWRSGVSFRKETEPYMTIARRAGSGGGVTAVDVNLKFVWEVVSRIKIGTAGVAYVVDGKGTLIAHPDISLVLKKTDLSKLPQVASLLGAAGQTSRPGVAAQPTLNSAEASLVTLEKAHDLAGNRVLAAHAHIPLLGWTVIVESPRAEAFKPLYETLLRMGLVLALGLLVSVAASAYLARALVRPIRALQEGATRVGAGELTHHIDVKTGDELEALAGQFNRMSGELASSYAGLERKVEARTAELQASLERQTATAEILQVISRSVADAQPVFDAIVASCQRLFGGQSVNLLLPHQGNIVRAATASHSEVGAPGGVPDWPLDEASVSGACILRGEVIEVSDAAAVAEQFPRSVELSRSFGWRSGLFAPLMHNGSGQGCIGVLRGTQGGFTEKEVSLLKTFTDQAVIAIQNARLFNEIEDKTRQLEAANRHKSEFLANMSHELRTPLNAIIGFSEALIEQMFGDVNDKQMEYLQDIHSSGQHLLSLINDVLDLSKIEAGKMDLELSSFDLGLLLDHSATLVRERAQRHGLTLTLEVGAGLDDWVADARKVKQAVVNLLSNAVKFTPNGGTVTVSARCLSTFEGRAGSWAQVQVSDTGIGIKPEDQALVFEEFRQASGDVLRKSEGTGLGLALVKRFIELHGGRVTLLSTPGVGSTFTLTLPQHELKALQ